MVSGEPAWAWAILAFLFMPDGRFVSGEGGGGGMISGLADEKTVDVVAPSELEDVDGAVDVVELCVVEVGAEVAAGWSSGDAVGIGDAVLSAPWS